MVEYDDDNIYNLLPCPFCTDKESKRNPPHFNTYKPDKYFDAHITVSCSCCGCEPNAIVPDKEMAAKFWNKRRDFSYRDYLKKSPYKCPVCDGRGGTVINLVIDTECHACKGSGIVWG